MSKLPIVAIVGRPNVGKSTLFNCLVAKKRTIVSEIPGTTRDSVTERVEIGKVEFLLVDTAGLTNSDGNNLECEIQTQSRVAAENADFVIFLVNGREEMTSDDFEIAKNLRRTRNHVIFVANKIDDGNSCRIFELTKFGFGDPIPISAKNLAGIWDLESEIERQLFDFFKKNKISSKNSENSCDSIKIAFAGRPNVGKSSLLNSFFKKKKVIVSDTPGTTRDAIDVDFFDSSGKKFKFVDTAGLRKRGKLGRGLEFWASVRTLRAIENCDVCVILIDAIEGVSHQDLAIVGRAIEAGVGIIIGVNKFDIVRNLSREDEKNASLSKIEESDVKMWGKNLSKIQENYIRYLRQKISFVPWAGVSFFSAKTGWNIEKILEIADKIVIERKKRVGTSELNRTVSEIYNRHISPSLGSKLGKIKFVEQVGVNPPKFLFFVNNTASFHFSYRRYLENQIRKKYGFFGTPIRIEMRDAMKKFRRR